MASRTPGKELLRRYLKAHGIKVAAAAEALGVAPAAIFQWREGRTKPSAVNRAALETWSSGFVPASSWPALPAAKQVVPYGAAS